MQTFYSVAEIRGQVAAWRAAGERVALVPTMGNLHAGHIDLVDHARQLAPRTVVSIFVNPTQFGPREDFRGYPRTMEEDQASLQAAGTDALFAPSVEDVYPRGVENATRVEVPGISNILCGEFRPGHFQGVAQIVAKLFNMVLPDVAVFGEKDRQQLTVVRWMAEDLNIPVEIAGVPTIRDPDGLAMSSRNAYLTPEERALAPTLYLMLREAVEQLRRGQSDYRAIEESAMASLAEAGFRPEYFRVLRAEDFTDPGPGESRLMVVGAAWLGRARLIDNLLVDLQGAEPGVRRGRG